jgi:hypothetical protein
MIVYLVWDHTRAEHGEGPLLANIFTTRSLALQYISDEERSDESLTGYLNIDACEVKDRLA